MKPIPVTALAALIEAARKHRRGVWEPLEWTVETDDGGTWQIQVVRTG